MIKEETEKRKADKPLPTKVPQEGIRKIITAGRKLLRYREEHHKAINMILTQPITKRGYKEGHIICSFCYKGREVTIIDKCGLFFEHQITL